VLSDFLSPEPVGVWRQVSRRHQVIALRLVDPREERLPDAGLLDLEASEDHTRCVVDSSSRGVRTAYAEAAERRRTEFRRFCASAGLSGFEIPPALDPIGPLTQLFTGRARRRGAP